MTKSANEVSSFERPSAGLNPMSKMKIFDYNRKAWDQQVKEGNRWTVPVTAEVTSAARRGDWSILLTPTKPVPRDWFGELNGLKILCLACGGGQQSPVLAAAGAAVTVLDLSPSQLKQDQLVAERDGLSIETVLGRMDDLSFFADGQFDLVFHPCSNCFTPDVKPVWKEAFRVLSPEGSLLSGFGNPVEFIFDETLAEEQRRLVVRHKIPYSDLTSLSKEERRNYEEKQEPLMFGHTLADQIGGQIEAGFVLNGFYEDRDPEHPLSEFLPAFIATRATKA